MSYDGMRERSGCSTRPMPPHATLITAYAVACQRSPSAYPPTPQVLGILHALQLVLIHWRLLAPLPQGAGRREMLSCVTLNSITLAAACSTYYRCAQKADACAHLAAVCGGSCGGQARVVCGPAGRKCMLFSWRASCRGLRPLLCHSPCGKHPPPPSAWLRSLCGNGRLTVDQTTNTAKEAVCARWLRPIFTAHYPTFSAWMLYGEGGGSGAGAGTPGAVAAPGAPFASGSNATSGVLSALLAPAAPPLNITLALPFDGVRIVSMPDGSIISPVFTMWISLVALFVGELAIAALAAR